MHDVIANNLNSQFIGVLSTLVLDPIVNNIS